MRSVALLCALGRRGGSRSGVVHDRRRADLRRARAPGGERRGRAGRRHAVRVGRFALRPVDRHRRDGGHRADAQRSRRTPQRIVRVPRRHRRRRHAAGRRHAAIRGRRSRRAVHQRSGPPGQPARRVHVRPLPHHAGSGVPAPTWSGRTTDGRSPAPTTSATPAAGARRAGSHAHARRVRRRHRATRSASRRRPPDERRCLARTALALPARRSSAGACCRATWSSSDKWPDGTVTMQLQLGHACPRAERRLVELGAVAESALGEWNGVDQPAAIQRRARFLEPERRRQRRQQRVLLERRLRHGVRQHDARGDHELAAAQRADRGRRGVQRGDRLGFLQRREAAGRRFPQGRAARVRTRAGPRRIPTTTARPSPPS